MYLQVTRYSESAYGQKRPLWTTLAQPVALVSIAIVVVDSFVGRTNGANLRERLWLLKNSLTEK